VCLIFVLGVFYFSLQDRRVGTAFRVYSSGKVVAGMPTAFAVQQFDGAKRKDQACTVSSARVWQGGEEPRVQDGADASPSIPAVFVLDTSGLRPGPAKVVLTVHGEGGVVREIETSLEVEPPGAVDEPFALLDVLDAPLAAVTKEAGLPEDKWKLDLTITGGGLVEGVPNRVYLRTWGKGKEVGPVDVVPAFKLDDGEKMPATRSGKLGISTFELAPSGPNQDLMIELPLKEGVLAWQEMISPDRLASIVVPRSKSTRTGLLDAQVLTSSLSSEFFCMLWRGRGALDVGKVVSEEGRATFQPVAPVPGLYWLTCGELGDSDDGFRAFAPVLVGEEPSLFLSRMLRLVSEDPFFKDWDPARLSPAERSLATDYFLARLAPDGLSFVQVANTYADDLKALEAKTGELRTWVLVLIGAVGLSLLFWAVAVTLKQHRSMVRSFREFQQEEEVGDELAGEGIARKRSYIPGILVILSILTSVVALVFLLRLIFL